MARFCTTEEDGPDLLWFIGTASYNGDRVEGHWMLDLCPCGNYFFNLTIVPSFYCAVCREKDIKNKP